MNLEVPVGEKELVVSTVVGGVTFPVLLGLAQSAVFKPLRITCGSGVLASLVGGASVCLASCVASLAMIKTCSLVQKWQSSVSSPKRTVTFSTPEFLLSTVSGAVVFRALGGRYSSALPSSLLKPGAFAREWIPAKGTQYATSCEKDMIQQLGQKYGCHSCGKRRVNLFVADHQPPSKILPSLNLGSSGILQKFYPQCQRCASIQGGVITANSISQSIRTHYLSLRLYHLFVPIPFGIAYLKTSNYDTGEADHEDTKQCTEVAIQVENVEESSQIRTTLRRMVDTDLSSLVTNFPLLIIWKRVMGFLDSFHPVDGFHVTLWMFGIVAAIGTL